MLWVAVVLRAEAAAETEAVGAPPSQVRVQDWCLVATHLYY